MFYFPTRQGVVSIVPAPGGRFQVMFQGESLGSYHHPAAAADDVAGGHTFTPSSGIDLGRLGIPQDLSEWSRSSPR